jgi:sulfur carrier protein ThiS
VPTITVVLPAALTAPQPPHDYVCKAATVGDALRDVVAQAPQFGPRIFYGERLLVVVTLNGRQVPPGGVQDLEVADGDRIDVLLPVAGG